MGDRDIIFAIIAVVVGLFVWGRLPVLTTDRLAAIEGRLRLRRFPALGRVYPVNQLQSGDIVAMQMGLDSRGNPHTHLIRLQQSSRDWAQRQY